MKQISSYLKLKYTSWAAFRKNEKARRALFAANFILFNSGKTSMLGNRENKYREKRVNVDRTLNF